jgi:hypothetical protein
MVKRLNKREHPMTEGKECPFTNRRGMNWTLSIEKFLERAFDAT